MISRAVWTSLALLSLLASPALGAPLEFTTPKEWKVEEPKSTMRAHQYKVPRAEGDTRDAKVIVYYFGKHSGGTIEDNLKRWKSQIERGEGDPEPKKTELTCGGFKVVLLELTGTYTAPQIRPNAPKAKPQPGSRTMNAIIQTPEGNYFVRFLGLKATVTKHEKAFRAWLDSVVLADKAAKGPDSRPTSQPTSRPAGQ